MSQALQRTNQIDPAAIMERVITAGDLAQLTPKDRTNYYNAVCESVGLNPLTRPFEYINLSGKLVLYARKDATDQLRRLQHVSVEIVAREKFDDVYVVTARATTPDGRSDESTGAVAIRNLGGDALCNAMMKAETKAKRRVTLSVCGLGFLDESETDTIPGARPHAEPTQEATSPARALPPATEGSPEQKRAQMIVEIKDLCVALNEAGYEPKWTPVTLKTFTNNEFIVQGGVDALNMDDLRALRAKLSSKLDALNAEADAERSLAGNGATNTLSRAAAAGAEEEEEDTF